MKITEKALRHLARTLELGIQGIESGYRVLRPEENSNALVYPVVTGLSLEGIEEGKLVPHSVYASKKECLAFLQGVRYAQDRAKEESHA